MKFKSKSLTIEGEKFEIREFSARQRQEMFKLYKGETDPVEAQAHSIKLACIQFSDKTIDEILDMPGTVFAELSEGIMKLSGLADDDSEKNS